MESMALILALAFVTGLAFRSLGYPPLLGYLLAGFVGASSGIGDAEQLTTIADLGVTLLLFTIGLKLRFSVLAKRYIIFPTLAHLAAVVPLTAGVIILAGMVYSPMSLDSWTAPWTLALALSFSSTVFAIKIFDERGDSQSFHAAITIGVLVIQDVLAVVYLVIASGKLPSPWSLLFITFIACFKVWAPVLSRLLGRLGHGELQLLFGVVSALGAYELFELMQLKGGLGALTIAAIYAVANPEKATELYKRLAGLKNLLLIAFFLQIGYAGTPTLQMFLIAVVLTLLLLMRPVIYFALFTFFRLRARTSTLAGTALFTYSEFGLIVAAIATDQGIITDEWLVIIALAISMSFVLSTPVNQKVTRWYRSLRSQLLNFQKEILPEEQIETIENARVVILGMGRVGKSAYRYLTREFGDEVVGVEESNERKEKLCELGIRCVHGDATDRDFWEQAKVAECETILMSLSSHREHIEVVELARELGFDGTLSVTASYDEESQQLVNLGCIAFNMYDDVGSGFAELTMTERNNNEAASSQS